MVEALHIVGLICSLVSVVLSNIGILIQKYSADVEKGKPLCRRWRFWVGFCVNMGSEIVLSTIALNLAPLALIAPSGGFGIIFNAFFARYGCVCGQKEILTRADWAATFMLFGGVLLVAMSGPGSEETEQPRLEELPTQMAKPAYLAFTSVAVVCVVTWVLLTHLKRFRKYKPDDSSITTTICASSTASMIGAYSVVFLKIVAIAIPALVTSCETGCEMPPPVFWPCIPFLATVGPMQLYLLNVALASGQAMFAIPLYLSLICVFISFSAGILFNEFESLMRAPLPLYLVLYSLGLVLVMGALAALSYSQWLKSRISEKVENTTVALRQSPGPGAAGNLKPSGQGAHLGACTPKSSSSEADSSEPPQTV